jgi:hypothetical protein
MIMDKMKEECRTHGKRQIYTIFFSDILKGSHGISRRRLEDSNKMDFGYH